jgi:DNA-binding NtrC family response regulator
MLESVGYKVILTSNALEGLEVYKTQQQFIELIILDFHLPDFSGKETFQRLKQINHGSKIVITSGFEYSKEIQETINQGAMGFLRKPFNRDQIITTIQKIFRLHLKL